MRSFAKRTISRLGAIQALYIFDFCAQTSEDIQKQILEIYEDGFDFDSSLELKIDKKFFSSLTSFAIEKVEHIDSIILECVSEINFSKVSRVILSIIRTGTAECLLFSTPPKVLGSEYTNITAEMLSDTDTAFVNQAIQKIVDAYGSKIC